MKIVQELNLDVSQAATRNKLNVLEIGAINTDLQKCSYMDVRAIDLNSQVIPCTYPYALVNITNESHVLLMRGTAPIHRGNGFLHPASAGRVRCGGVEHGGWS